MITGHLKSNFGERPLRVVDAMVNRITSEPRDRSFSISCLNRSGEPRFLDTGSLPHQFRN